MSYIVKIRNFASPNPIGSLSCNIGLCCFLLVHLFAAGYSLLPIGPALWYDFSHWSTIMLVHSYTNVLRSIQYIFIDSVSSCFSHFCTLAFFVNFACISSLSYSRQCAAIQALACVISVTFYRSRYSCILHF